VRAFRNIQLIGFRCVKTSGSSYAKLLRERRPRPKTATPRSRLRCTALAAAARIVTGAGPGLLLRAAARRQAALAARGGRSDALDKSAGWRDMSALLPKRVKKVRRAAGSSECASSPDGSARRRR
jgi:hypothetical protein